MSIGAGKGFITSRFSKYQQNGTGKTSFGMTKPAMQRWLCDFYQKGPPTNLLNEIKFVDGQTEMGSSQMTQPQFRSDKAMPFVATLPTFCGRLPLALPVRSDRLTNTIRPGFLHLFEQRRSDQGWPACGFQRADV